MVISLILLESNRHSLILANKSSGSLGGLRWSWRSWVMMSPKILLISAGHSIAKHVVRADIRDGPGENVESCYQGYRI